MRTDASDVRRYRASSYQQRERSCERERSRSRYKDVPVTKIKFGSAGLIYQNSAAVLPAKQAAEFRAPLQRPRKRQRASSAASESESSTPRRMARIATEKALEAAQLHAPKAEEGIKLVAKGGKDDVIRNIVVGSYHVHGENHGKKVWRRDAMAGENEVLIYYWDDRDGSSLAGWWIAPTIGGDEVWAFNKESGDVDSLPPEEDWCLPHDGPVDKSFTVSRVGSSIPAPRDAGNEVAARGKGKGTGSKKVALVAASSKPDADAKPETSEEESGDDDEEEQDDDAQSSEAEEGATAEPGTDKTDLGQGQVDPKAKASDAKGRDSALPRGAPANPKTADKDESEESDVVEVAEASTKGGKDSKEEEVEEVDASEDKEDDQQDEDSEEEDEADENQEEASSSDSGESGTDLQGALAAALSTKEDEKPPPKGVQERINAMTQSVEDEIIQMEQLQRHISERKKLEKELQAKATANGDSKATPADKKKKEAGTATFASAVQQQKEKLLARVANMTKRR